MHAMTGKFLLAMKRFSRGNHYVSKEGFPWPKHWTPQRRCYYLLQVSLDSSLAGAGGIEPARTTQLMADCDADFALMQGWFSGVTFPFSTPMEVDVNNDPSGSASWGPPVQLNDSSDGVGYLRMY